MSQIENIESTSTLRSLADLPVYDGPVCTTGNDPLSQDYSTLFTADSSRFRITSGKQLIVFRSTDLRTLAAHPAISNNPPDPYSLGKDADTNSHGASADTPMKRFTSNHLFTMDNASAYDGLRKIYARAFMAKPVACWASLAEAVVAEIVDEVAGTGEIDFTKVFTERLAIRLWGKILRIYPEEIAIINSSIDELSTVFLLDPSEDQLARLNEGVHEYIDVLSSVIRRALDDTSAETEWVREFASDYARSRIGELLPEKFEVVLAINLTDAFHTAAVAAANVMYLLLSNLNVLEIVRSDPSMVPSTVSEALRLLSPGPMTERYVNEDIIYEGFLIPKGTRLWMLWAAGNCDPEMFEAPNTFDIFRRQTAEHSFGGGPRTCPGRYFGRMLLESIVKQLTLPQIKIELSQGKCTLQEGSFARAMNSMPVTVEKRHV